MTFNTDKASMLTLLCRRIFRGNCAFDPVHRKLMRVISFSIVHALVLFIIAGCSPAPPSQHDIPPPHGKKIETVNRPMLPDDAAQVAERLAACIHFSGEFNGDQSERDKEVATAMSELHCDTIEQETDAIRNKYADNKLVIDALNSASDP